MIQTYKDDKEQTIFEDEKIEVDVKVEQKKYVSNQKTAKLLLFQKIIIKILKIKN